NPGDSPRQRYRIPLLALVSPIRSKRRHSRVVHRPRTHLAAFAGRSHRGHHPKRKRWRRLTRRSYHLRRRAPRNASLARDGLVRRAFKLHDVRASSSAHQFWHHAEVQISHVLKVLKGEKK